MNRIEYMSYIMQLATINLHFAQIKEYSFPGSTSRNRLQFIINIYMYPYIGDMISLYFVFEMLESYTVFGDVMGLNTCGFGQQIITYPVRKTKCINLIIQGQSNEYKTKKNLRPKSYVNKVLK